MQLPTYRRLTEQDLQDAPAGAWKTNLLYSINLFFQQLYTGLSNGLTPEQNDIAQVKTFSLIGSSTPSDNTATFTTNFNYYPLGRDLINIQPTDGSSPIFTSAPYVSWNFANGRFNVLGISGLTDGVTYSITIRIWWAAVVNA
jgi:hypothetical protein